MPLGELLSGTAELKESFRDAAKARVSQATLGNLVELITLRTHSLVEQFLEELFYRCMLAEGGVASAGSVVPVSNREQAGLLLRSSRGKLEAYLDWLPYHRTLDMARLYLNPGNAFEWLAFRPIELKALNELTVLRNEIAHGSDKAREEFTKLAASRNYPSARAADYLLSARIGVPEVMYMVTHIEVVATALSQTSELAAAPYLQPERPFQAGATAPAGNYVCERCGQGLLLRAGGLIVSCPACDEPTRCSSCGNRPAARTQWRRVIV